MDPADIRRLDHVHVWHPYTPAHTTNLPVTATDGIHLRLADGRRVIDAMSSWWAAVHGHGHPALVAAATEQIGRMSHVMFGGLTHEPAVRLATRLVDMTGLPHVFFSDSGSVAVEVAVKMALQYSRGIGHPERTRLLTWRSGYHGDTFAAMSVCDPDGGMHSLWAGTLAEQVFAPAPHTDGVGDYLDRFEMLVDATVAAVIIEPVVQGADGMRFHDPALVAGIREICDRHGILYIADEIATGLGRTGEMFATHGAGVQPDIMCVGKALTGGFMSLAATLCTAEVAAAIPTLMHGPTLMANPLACAVAGASLDLLAAGSWRADVARIEAGLRVGLEPLRGLAEDVRVLGAIGVVEMAEPVDTATTTRAALAEGCGCGPSGVSSTPCRPTSARTRRWRRSAAAWQRRCAHDHHGDRHGDGRRQDDRHRGPGQCPARSRDRRAPRQAGTDGTGRGGCGDHRGAHRGARRGVRPLP